MTAQPRPSVRLQALALTVCAALLLLAHARWGWVPILDSANLAFHEGGHPIFGLLSQRLAVWGGTLMQLLIPAACAFEMHRQDKPAARGLCVIWLGESLLNVARYIADARAQQLPLVGGADPRDAHDWSHILGHLGLLAWDTTLANGVRAIALALMAWAVWNVWRRPQPEPQ